MKLNRRNTIIGLGTIVAGGGAALGSGAFSSAEAQRELEVNVVTDEQIAADFVDIILNDVGTSDTIEVDDGSTTDATALFPDSDTDENEYENYTPNENDVSLMQNDVTIVFGPTDNELPPNSTVSYDGLVTVVNEQGDGDDFDVTFTVSDDEESTPEPDLDFEWDDNSEEPTVSADSSEDLSVDVNTGSEEESTGLLTIEITEST